MRNPVIGHVRDTRKDIPFSRQRPRVLQLNSGLLIARLREHLRVSMRKADNVPRMDKFERSAILALRIPGLHKFCQRSIAQFAVLVYPSIRLLAFAEQLVQVLLFLVAT